MGRYPRRRSGRRATPDLTSRTGDKRRLLPSLNFEQPHDRRLRMRKSVVEPHFFRRPPMFTSAKRPASSSKREAKRTGTLLLAKTGATSSALCLIAAVPVVRHIRRSRRRRCRSRSGGVRPVCGLSLHGPGSEQDRPVLGGHRWAQERYRERLQLFTRHEERKHHLGVNQLGSGTRIPRPIGTHTSG
jgi:hypothetical protein